MSSRVSDKPPVAPPQRAEPSKPFKALLDEAQRPGSTPPGLQRKSLPSAAPLRGSLTARPAVTVATTRPAVGRVGIEAEAQRLGAVRAQHGLTIERALSSRAEHGLVAERAVESRAHHAVSVEQATATRTRQLEHGETSSTNRAVELIVKELVAEFETRPGGSASSKLANPVQPGPGGNELPFPVSQPAPQAKPEARAAQAAALIERIDVFVRSQRPALALTLDNSLGARVEIEKLGPGRIALKLVGRNGPPSADTVNRIRDELRARGLQVGALSVG
ncbi:MAG: hypothetical protein JNJ54_14005 [Myxococcaceae bacterium]|nr:hypothetical protein [Myxococcaceae bacterium]